MSRKLKKLCLTVMIFYSWQGLKAYYAQSAMRATHKAGT